MTLIALKCPHCHSDDVGKHGICNGKQRYICKNPECPHTTFYTEYTYNACKPGVKEAVRKQAVNGSGVRAISRCLGISTDTVIAELKKRSGHKTGSQRDSLFQNGTDAQNRRRTNYQCLVFRIQLANSIILEHDRIIERLHYS